jgi:hypothetical protein
MKVNFAVHPFTSLWILVEKCKSVTKHDFVKAALVVTLELYYLSLCHLGEDSTVSLSSPHKTTFHWCGLLLRTPLIVIRIMSHFAAWCSNFFTYIENER